MNECDNTERHEILSTPQTQAAPPENLEFKQGKQKSRIDTKKAYSNPALNGSPGFSVHEEDGDVVFSPIRRLEFSTSIDETKHSDLTSMDSNFLMTQDLSSSLENLGNFSHFLGEPLVQSDLDKENRNLDDSDVSALVISNIQFVDNISVLSPDKADTDTLHNRQSIPVQGLDEDSVSLLQTRKQRDQSEDETDVNNSIPYDDKQLQQLGNDDQQGYYLVDQKYEPSIPSLNIQGHRYPADGRNKQTAKQLVTGSTVQGAFLPAYPTNLQPGLSFPPLVRTVPYGAEREEKKRSQSQMIASSLSNTAVKSKSPSNVPESSSPPATNEIPSKDERSQISPKTLLTVVPDRTKFMEGGSKVDIEACPRPEDMPGGAMHEIEVLRGQLQSAIQVPLKCQIDTDLFDYSQNETEAENQSDQLLSTINEVLSISNVDTGDSVSCLMDYATNSLTPEEANLQLLEPGATSCINNATTKLSGPVSHPLQTTHYRQMPLTNHSQYTSYLDNIKLKEELEKERFRRRHCEKYIEQLNAKSLDVQEQLAIAVSANRKKEMLVQVLDKQLAKIMSTWNAEKMQIINELQKEKLLREQEQRQLTKKMRDSLSDVMEELNREKDKTSRIIHKLEEMDANEKSLEKQLLKEKEQNRGMVEEWEYQSEKLHTSEQIIKELNNQMEQVQAKSIEREQELLNKIEEITESHKKLQEKEKEQVNELHSKVSESESRISFLEKELSEVKLQLENTSREKECLKVEMALIEAKHENNQKQLETHLESKMEKEITVIIEDVNKKRVSFENRLQEKHKQQIISLNEHHSVKLNALLQKYQMELKQNDNKFSLQLQNLEQTLKVMREENTSLKISNQRLESQRIEAINKFQTIMRLHWNEAISILGGSTLADSQAFSEVTEQSAGSESSGEGVVPLLSFPVKEPERSHLSPDPNQMHPHPQTSSPKKDGMNVSSFTINSEQISSITCGQRRSRHPDNDGVHHTDVVPNYLKSLTIDNMEERNQVLHNSERGQRKKEIQENSPKPLISEKTDTTVLEPDANILWYEKDSLQPSFIQTGPYMTAVPMRPAIQQDRQSHLLTNVNRSSNERTSDANSRSTSMETEIQNVEYCPPDNELTPPIRQRSQPKDGNQNQVSMETSKLKGEYQIPSEHSLQQNSRQEDLQHFIQMLLNRIPVSNATDSANQYFEEKQSEFLPLEVTNGNSTGMSQVINMSQSQDKPERLVQAQYFPPGISQPQQQQTQPATVFYQPGGPSANSFSSGLAPSYLQDIQHLLEAYKPQTNGEVMRSNFIPTSPNDQQEDATTNSERKQDPASRIIPKSTGLVKQSTRSNKVNETKSREKTENPRRNRASYNRVYEKKKTKKTSLPISSSSNSSMTNTSGGNPIWK